ncbi:DMT family transporter [Kitasatospora sp. NPDC059827]|uniref:DMT family transporter n=1 Tax=Kitasatospora sp. NPDC059827 TaxID=3346964 RepID=UPI00364C48C9
MAVLALLWGSGFLWIRIALQHGLTPVQITVLRAALGAAVLLLLARSAGQRLPRGGALWRRLAVAAFFCNALPFLLTAYGERSVGSGLAGVLHATTPLWSLLIGFALGTERARGPLRLVGLLLGFAGVLLILAPWRNGGGIGDGIGGGSGGGISIPGALTLLGAAASYAIAFAYMARAFAGTDTAPLALSAAQLSAAAGLSVIALPTVGPLNPLAGADPLGLAAVTVLGIACTGLTFHLNYRLIATEGPTGAATVGYLLPVVSTALGALFLGEQLTVRAVAGMAVVLAGVFLVKHRPKPAPAPASASAPASAPVPTGPAPAPVLPDLARD